MPTPLHHLSEYADAVVMTPYDETSPILAKEMVVSVGGNSMSKNWVPKKMPIGAFVAQLCQHREGAKDGLSFVLADMVPGQRKKVAVKAIYGVGIDIDVGTSSARIDAALKKFGKLAVRYTTHSHLKMTTEIRKDLIAKWCNKEAHGADYEEDEVLREYLRSTGNWDEAILKTAEFSGMEHKEGGIMVCIKHAPIPKHRIVVPLTAPFDVSAEAPTQQEAMAKWAKVPTALARELSVPLDKSCLDPSRLFYFPRHAKGKPFEISLFGGDLFDFRDLSLDDPFEAEIAKLTKGTSKSQTEAGKALGRWSMKAAHGFQVVQVLEEHAPDKLRHQVSSGWEIECPFDELHSNAGDSEDRACLAVNAGDGPSEWFTVRCQHASCSDKTNLDMLGKMVEDDWFANECLDDAGYNAVVSDGPDVNVMLASLTSETPSVQVQAVVEAIVRAGYPELDRARALKKVRSATGASAKAIQSLARQFDTSLKAASEPAPEPMPEDQLAKLITEFPVPPTEFGDFSYRMVDGRPWLHLDPGGARGLVKLWTPIAIRGGTIMVDRSDKRGVRIDVMDEDSRARSLNVAASDAYVSYGTPLKIALRDAGACMSEEGENRIVRLIKERAPPKPIKIFDRPGWRGPGLFITPWGSASYTNRQVELADESIPPGCETSGTLAAWKSAIATVWSTDVLQFKIAPLIACGAVLIDLCDMDSAWVAFTSKTSRGKTTAARLQASVWGDTSPKRGLYAPMNGTENAAEARLAQSSGAGFAFDETNLISGDRLQTLIFKGSGGAGNDRLSRSAQLRQARVWRGLFTLTGEHDLMRKIKSGGGAATTGVGTRVLELNCEETTQLSSEKMARIEAAYSNHGHAGKAFVRTLLDMGVDTDVDRLVNEIEKKALALAGKGASAAVVRAARIAAVIWRAGEIAQQANLIPQDDSLPVDLGLEATIRAFWTASQESDLAPANNDDVAVRNLFESLIRNRGGSVAEQIGEGSRTADAWRLPSFADQKGPFYIVPERVLPDLAGGALNAKALGKVLDKMGAILKFERKGGQRIWWDYIAGIGKVRSLVIFASAVEDDPEIDLAA